MVIDWIAVVGLCAFDGMILLLMARWRLRSVWN